MENVNLEIKRMLSLLESKMGNLKPLISEDDKPGQSVNLKTPEDWLKWLKGSAGCITNKGGTIDSPEILYTKQEKIDNFIKSGINDIKVNEPYLLVTLEDKNSKVKYRFNVFGRQGRGRKNTFLMVKDRTDQVGEKDRFVEASLYCSEIERQGSLVSQGTNITADQKTKLDYLIGTFGVKNTGWTLTDKKPDGTEGTDFETVDLNSGQGVNNDYQYINPKGLDGLDPEFKEAGKYYIWAVKGQKVKQANIVDNVERELVKMGYTRDQQKAIDANGIGVKSTTLDAECTKLGSYCEGTIIKNYIKGGGGTEPIWKLNQQSYKDMGASSMRAGKTRRAIKNVQKTEASKRKCRAAILALHSCMKRDNDNSCKTFIQAAYGQMGENMPEYIQARLDLADQIDACEDLNVDVGSKYDSMWNELKTSTSEFSPYSQKNKEASSLEESLSRNIRLSLKEMRTRR